MSTSKDGDPVGLTVSAADEATEIFIIDGQFRLVGRGLGRMHANLEPGIYKVKARAGLTTREQHVVLFPGQPQSVNLGPIPFTSPAPLSQTLKTHEYHMGAAQQLSGNIHVRAGEGSSIFVFARDWTPPGQRVPRQQPPRHPAQGLSLRNSAGGMIADFAGQSASDLSQDPWSACRVEVNPGAYRLRLELPPGVLDKEAVVLEQSIVASPNWQTQVFLLQRDYGKPPGDRFADLLGASVLICDHTFDPGRPDLRLAELARLGLTKQRQVLTREVSEMLWEKYNNPMLGIYGGHLLLLSPEPDMQLLQTVVTNLRKLLGTTHPDVEALALRLPEGESNYHWDFPPLLRRSWSILLDASVKQPDLIPAESFSAKVADRLWGEGAWLVWIDPPDASTADQSKGLGGAAAPEDAYKRALRIQLAQIRQGSEGPAARPEPAGGVSFELPIDAGGENDTNGYSLDADSATDSPSGEPIQLDEASFGQLVSVLRIPRGNIENLLRDMGSSG